MAKEKTKPNLVVEVLRDYDGKLFSQVRDKNSMPSRSVYLSRSVVIDREKGRGMSQDTIRSRASALADILGLALEEDLTWPCRARQGHSDCTCPECVAKIDARGK